MEIQLKDLRRVTEMLYSHLEKKGHTNLTIDSDFYWNISKEQKYDTYEEPKDFDQGQLSDDWRELELILKGKQEPIAYGLVWLATLLRKIGEDITV